MAENWKHVDGTVASVVEYHTKGGKCYSVVFTYKVDGSWLGGTFTTMTPHQKGDVVIVSYDPLRPEVNNFLLKERRMRWVYIVFFTLLGIMAVYLFTHPNVK